MEQVKLNFSSDHFGVRIGELCGHDECSVSGADTAAAINLVDQLIQTDSANNLNQINAIDLSSSDRDRILAEVYINTYGPAINSIATCQFCGKKFDLNFMLTDLITSLYSNNPDTRLNEDGSYDIGDGRCFRLPTGADELAIQGMSGSDAAIELIKRCVVKGDPAVESDKIEAVMEEVAPQLNLDLDAKCPECNKNQLIRFDIQTYLLSALMQEKKMFGYEVHLIAKTYKWSLNEIYSLTRSQRRAYASLIESEYSD